VIVRIATENQYQFPDDQADRLNDLDNAVVAAVEAGDEDRFHETFEELLALVRSEGSLVDEETLEESDIILPPPDISITEAAADFTGEGLIPD
jgi:hypothetical protein